MRKRSAQELLAAGCADNPISRRRRTARRLFRCFNENTASKAALSSISAVEFGTRPGESMLPHRLRQNRRTGALS